MQPIIKWTGSKRSQARTIVDRFPKQIDTYYEPFVGSGAVMMELIQRMERGEIECRHIVASDINDDLIGLWWLIQSFPDVLASMYKDHYDDFSRLDIDGKKKYYKKIVREMNASRFNKDIFYHALFFWVRRTCFNGLVRYNKKGEFNAPCHFTRNGMDPDTVHTLANKWSALLNKYKVEFLCRSYESTVMKENDFIYLDPPYANTGTSMYSGVEFDNESFYKWIDTLPRFAMSYDGKTDMRDNTQDVPFKYDEHIYLKSGKSSFSKLVTETDINVNESLYLKYGKFN